MAEYVLRILTHKLVHHHGQRGYCTVTGKLAHRPTEFDHPGVIHSMVYTGSSRRLSDIDDAGDEHFFKLIDIRYSDDYGNEDDDERFGTIRRGIGNNNSRSSAREAYLRSFKFCRDTTVQERVKSELKAAAAWAVDVSRIPSSLPRRVRRVKDKLTLRSLFCCFSSTTHQRSRAGAGSRRFLQSCFVAT